MNAVTDRADPIHAPRVASGGVALDARGAAAAAIGLALALVGKDVPGSGDRYARSRHRDAEDERAGDCRPAGP
jgi:hypothetical protein